MIGRQKLKQAVSLRIGLDRGYYLGTVAREKAQALTRILEEASPQEWMEYTERIK